MQKQAASSRPQRMSAEALPEMMRYTRSPSAHHQIRANSKQARVLALSAGEAGAQACGSIGQTRPRSRAEIAHLLRGPSGATIASVMRSTGWQPHTVRGFLAAVVRKKLGSRLSPPCDPMSTLR